MRIPTVLKNKEEKTPERKRGRRFTTAAIIVAAVAAVSIGISGLFNSTKDIITPDMNQPAPVVEVYNMPPEEPVIPEAPEEEEEKKRKSLKERMRQWIEELPAAVRGGVVLPLYLLGTFLLKLLSGIGTTVLAPLLVKVLGWLGLALVILAAAAITLKALYPDIPLKEILNKKTLISVFLSVAVMAAINEVMPHYFPDYEKWKQIFIWALGFCAACLVVVPTAISIGRRRRHYTGVAEP